MKDNQFSPLIEGLNQTVETQPEPVVQPAPSLFKFEPEAPSILETSMYVKPEEETSWFDDTWGIMKASAETSAGGDWVKQKMFKLGLIDISPEVAGLYTALGADPQDMFSNFDLDFEVNTDYIDLAMKQGVRAEFIPMVQKSYNKENFVWNVQRALDAQTAYDKVEAAPIGSQLVGGVVEAGLDPFTYATGGASVGMNFAKKALMSGTEAAIGSVPSELFKELRTGKEAEYANAALGAFVFGTSFSALSDGVTAAVGTRMKARNDSIEADIDDVSRMNVEVPEGQPFVLHPTEKGAVITRQGDVISSTNPVNPNNLEAAREANKGLKFLNLQDINQTVMTSTSEQARIIGSDLMRSSTGLKGGGTGKAGMVADDIISMMEGRDNQFTSKFSDTLRQAMRKQVDQDSEMYYRKIVTSIESGKTDGLNAEDLELIKLWQNQMTAKSEAATNPSMFGRADAKPVFSTARDSMTYVPQVFDIGKTNMVKQRLGGWEGLQAELKANWKQQFAIDHNGVRTRLKEIFDENNPELPEGADAVKLFDDFVEDYIEKKTYGISKNGDFTHSSVIEDMNYNDSLVGIQNNNFALERNVFDSSFITIAQDGQPFTLNDMRLMDMEELASMYNRRINGDIAIHGATGKTTQELKDSILQLDDPKAQKALKDWVKLATGRSRRDPQGVWDMLGRSIMDMTYVSKNAMMWHMQAAEGVGFVADRMMKLVRGGVPAVNHMFNPTAKFSKKDLAEFRSAMFGQELNTRLTSTYKGVRDALVEQGVRPTAAGTVAGIRQSTAWLANKSPFSKVFNKTTETLVGLARGGVISDLTDAAMLGKNKFTDAYLRNASITPEQFDGILKLLKDNTKVNSKGEYKADIEKIIRDVRANDLWRLADYVANDQVFRTNKISQNFTAAPNTLGMMALQFKSFMIKGINGKFLKMVYESGQGRAADHMLNSLLATGVSSGLYVMQVHYKAQGLPESERQAYLDKQLGWGNILFQGINRSSVTGSPLGALSMAGDLATGADLFTAARTTVVGDTEAPKWEPNATNAYKRQQEFLGRLGRQFPSLATGAGLATAIDEGREWMWAEEGYDELSHGKAFFNALRQIIPNDPMMQALLNDMAENAGVLDKMN